MLVSAIYQHESATGIHMAHGNIYITTCKKEGYLGFQLSPCWCGWDVATDFSLPRDVCLYSFFVFFLLDCPFSGPLAQEIRLL